MSQDSPLVVRSAADMLLSAGSRRGFLRTIAAGGSVLLLPSLFACSDDDDPVGPGGPGVVLDLSTDIGILNYAYALEQLEAAYYTEVVNRFTQSGITAASERAIFTDLRNHEVIHREFLKSALGTARIADLAVDFGNAYASRQSVIQTAVTFEDLGVSAYNGAAKYIKRVENLLLAGKIVSVEARHAAVVRDLMDTTGVAFANNANAMALGLVNEPAAVLAAADPFITTAISIGRAPTVTT